MYRKGRCTYAYTSCSEPGHYLRSGINICLELSTPTWKSDCMVMGCGKMYTIINIPVLLQSA
jgi:hypothetical protein